MLARGRMSKLVAIDLATGLPIREDKPRYEIAAPGGLVHADIKLQGRIPDDGGSTAAGRADRSGSAVAMSSAAVPNNPLGHPDSGSLAHEPRGIWFTPKSAMVVRSGLGVDDAPEAALPPSQTPARGCQTPFSLSTI